MVIIIYVAAQIVSNLATGSLFILGSVSFWHIVFSLWTPLCFMVQQNILGFPCTSLVSALELGIAPRKLISLRSSYWEAQSTVLDVLIAIGMLLVDSIHTYTQAHN